jgi:uncharacterized OB-fold protein
MTEQTQFTIEQLCKSMSKGKMIAAKCCKCGTIQFPPRPLCHNCFSTEFETLEIQPKGKLLSYTIIHVAPTQFQSMAPYAVGILQLDHGLKIPGMIRKLPVEQVKIGLTFKIAFESCQPTGQWPQWPRYYFEPA